MFAQTINRLTVTEALSQSRRRRLLFSALGTLGTEGSPQLGLERASGRGQGTKSPVRGGQGTWDNVPLKLKALYAQMSPYFVLQDSLQRCNVAL